MFFASNHGAQSSSSYHPPPPPPPCREFTLPEIELATNNFNESRLLGKGGFVKVYKGTITDGESLLDVAIKPLTSKQATSVEDAERFAKLFWDEVETLYRLRHPHLVSQIGYASDGQEMIFVYDYMPRGTLYHHLHKGGLPLSWVRRLKICLETARGLEFLHSKTKTKSKVLHLDVKSSNILLASTWAAKLSDFGLSKVRPSDSTYLTDHVGGTLGYLDPYYQRTNGANRKTDVFAFGVVMLEVLCGKTAYPIINGELQFLRSWALAFIEKKMLNKIIDPTIDGKISYECLKNFTTLAQRCLHSSPKQRPCMADVVKDLESILALQEKADDTSLTKLFATTSYESGDSVLRDLDRILYTVLCEDRIVQRFDFKKIVHVTENFSKTIGLLSVRDKSMYKGKLQQKQAITIARYVRYFEFISFSDRACKKVASILVETEHENVIRLLGYCVDGRNAFLVYDFACIATLAGLIFDHRCNILDWNKRYKIIIGVARGLVYLHNYAPFSIIHHDVNPENILLDESFGPKLSGFEFARAVKATDRYLDPELVNRIHGTPEHIAPELLSGSWLSTKADVFSFGVFILNIVTGQKAFDGTRVAEMVKRNWLEGTLSDIVDPRIKVADSILMTNFMEIGLLCVQHRVLLRPTMEQVVDMLLSILSPTSSLSKMQERMIDGEPLYLRNNLYLDTDSQQPCHKFTHSEIKVATHNFDKSLVIERGMSSKIYRGTIAKGETRLNFAIMRLRPRSREGAEAELWAEVELLSKLQHRHLASLIDNFSDGHRMSLVFEHLPDGTLADCFRKGRVLLKWMQRLKICLEVARCLDYLHREADTKPGVVHCNVKSSNVLIASNGEAKLSGLWFCETFLKSKPYHHYYEGTLLVVGDEYQQIGEATRDTRDSDVSSFGKVMFTVLSGKEAIYKDQRLAKWIQANKLEKFIDPNLRGIASECLKKFAELAGRCVRPRNPSMAEVVADLEFIRQLQDG